MLKKSFFVLLAVLLSAVSFMAPAYASMAGDLDGDGTVSPEDARLTLRAAVRLEIIEKSLADFQVADVDRNGEIEPADARHILRASVGLEDLEELARGDIDWILCHNAEWWKEYKNPALCKAFYDQVKQLTAQSGKGRIAKDEGSAASLCGLSVVRLIDLDRDGTPELCCGFSKNKTSFYSDKEAIYRFYNGKLETLYIGQMPDSGSDYSPMVAFREIDGTVYVVGGNVFDRIYGNLANGRFNKISFFEDQCYINGKEATPEQSEAARKTFYERSDVRNAVIRIYDFRDGAQERYQATLKETEEVIALLKNGAKQ